MEEDRGRSADRLVTFTDAVVAIAVTLLALPLADIVREVAARPDRNGLDDVLDAAALPLLAFTISFFAISRLWWSHHRVFEHVRRWDRLLVQVTVVWLFTIVLLAPVTALIGLNNPTTAESTGEVAIYLGTMTASSVLLTVLAWHVRRTPALTDGHDGEAGYRLFTSIETTIGFGLALLIGTLVPAIHYFALLTLVITGPVGRLIWRRRHPAR